jgi:hypothetical protein
LSQNSTSQLIPPGGALRAKVGSRFGALDMSAIAKAEAALKSLSGNFAQWMQDELAKLATARARVQAEGMTPEAAEQLYMRAHDMKGLGTTYEFPIVTRIAGSLCKLIDEPSTRADAPMPLVDAHIDAINAAVRDGIKTVDHPVGKALVEALEARVRALGFA